MAAGWVSAVARARRKNGDQVSPFTKQYVDHLAVLIDGAVEVALDVATEEEDLVDVPAAAKPTTMPPGCGRELWTEGLGPAEHGPGRDINATLTKELGYLTSGERVAQVPTDRGDDDLRRPTVAREGAAGSVGEVSMTEMAGEALTAAAVETITRSGRLVAGRASGHRPTLPRAPHDFADSGSDGETATSERVTYSCSEPGCCQNCCQADRWVAAQH